MSLPKVAIGIPYYRTAEGPTLNSALGMAFHSASRIQVMPITCSGAYVEVNRNGIVEYAMEVEKGAGFQFDYLFWMDTDMIFPADTLLRLIGHGKDIVGANYRIRVAPFVHAGGYLDGTDKDVEATGLVRMSHLPTGLLLTRFDVYRKLEYPWFRAPSTKNEPRDDVYFCKSAREAGYEIWCDQDLTREVHHRTSQDLGWFDPGQLVYQGAALSDEKMRAEGEARARSLGESIAEREKRAAD